MQVQPEAIGRKPEDRLRLTNVASGFSRTGSSSQQQDRDEDRADSAHKAQLYA